MTDKVGDHMTTVPLPKGHVVAVAVAERMDTTREVEEAPVDVPALRSETTFRFPEPHVVRKHGLSSRNRSPLHSDVCSFSRPARSTTCRPKTESSSCLGIAGRRRPARLTYGLHWRHFGLQPAR